MNDDRCSNNNDGNEILSLYDLLDIKEVIDDKNINHINSIILSDLELEGKKKQFCYICGSLSHSLYNCIDLYLFRDVNKYPRFKREEIMNILKNNCLCVVELDGKTGYIISSKQIDEIKRCYDIFLVSRGVNPFMPYLFRNVKRFHYNKLGKDKDQVRESAFVLADMVFDYLHPDIIKRLIRIGVL